MTPLNIDRQFPIKHHLQKLSQLELVDLIAFASLLLFLRFGFVDWYFQLTVDFALLAVIFSRLKIIYHWSFWFVAALVGSIALIQNWDTTDNHKYIFVYWMWVMTLTFATQDLKLRDQIVRFNSRYFLILIFIGAALQKSLSPTYMSGEMFELIVSLENRFRAFSILVGIEVETLDQIKKQYTNIASPAVELAQNKILLPINNQISWIAKLITWYDLYVQVVIGLLFVFSRRVTDLWGHIFLLFFILTTYIPAPVFGFGWTISTMGIALSWNRFPRVSNAYLISFVAVLIYQIPWRSWIIGLA